MAEFLLRRGLGRYSSFLSGGLIPEVTTLPHGRVPELLGFSEEEILELPPSRALGPVVVHFLGECRGSCRSHGRSGRAIRRSPAARMAASGSRVVSSSATAFRRRPSRRSHFGCGLQIRTLSNINQDPRNRPLQLVCRPLNLQIVSSKMVRNVPPKPFVSSKTVGNVPPKPLVPQSFHPEQMDKPTDNREGRYHPENEKLTQYGIWGAICQDLGAYKVPPPWWPEPFTWSDFYTSSSSSEVSASPSMYRALSAYCKLSGDWRQGV